MQKVVTIYLQKSSLKPNPSKLPIQTKIKVKFWNIYLTLAAI
jgi:hypothetical protein